MDKKTFAKTITQVLRDYGFVNSGSCHFYLNLERVVVWVERMIRLRRMTSVGCIIWYMNPYLKKRLL